jgi:hypothetical protein
VPRLFGPHGHDEQIVASVGRTGNDGALGAESVDQARSPELAAVRPHEDVANLEYRAAVPRLPRRCVDTEQFEFARRGSPGSEERIDAGRVRVEHLSRFVVEAFVIDLRGFRDPHPSHEGIEGDRPGAEELGEPARRAPAVELHLPEAILCVDETLAEECVVSGPRSHMRDPQPVAQDLDRCVEIRHADRSVELGERHRGIVRERPSGLTPRPAEPRLSICSKRPLKVPGPGSGA